MALAPAKRRFKVLGMGASTLPGVLGSCVISKRDARDHSCDLDLIFICTVSIFATSRRRQVRVHGGDAQRKRGGMAGRAYCQLSVPSGPLVWAWNRDIRIGAPCTWLLQIRRPRQDGPLVDLTVGQAHKWRTRHKEIANRSSESRPPVRAEG